MIGGGRIIGIGLMVVSAVLLVGFVVWGSTEGTLTDGGFALGTLLALMVLAPIFGIGFYLLRRGGEEERQFAVVKQEKKLLNIVLTQGKVTIPELVAELSEPREDIEEMIRDLVGKQLFSGAINWDKGILYSVESQALTEQSTCPNCGGKLEFAGKGLIVCPYCGSEVFLTKRAAAATA
ncbi:MAG: hypothetical protein KDE54_08055 [Caldilineaceae bacterium]|nr:hypothetical protein [Caldilineaceae bacterium]MCB0138767.1 hypothetical protein [Caldilineaceae bacterium]